VIVDHNMFSVACRGLPAPSQLRETSASDGNGRQLLSDKAAGQGRNSRLRHKCPVSVQKIYTIFEGTSEIQRLVISRAISGMRIR
jgi:hypothetical protein